MKIFLIICNAGSHSSYDADPAAEGYGLHYGWKHPEKIHIPLKKNSLSAAEDIMNGET